MKFFKTRPPHKNAEELNGRYTIIKNLTSTPKKTLDLGCKNTHFGDITIDIEKAVSPNIVADACNLPLKDHTFERIIFSEVIEHLPEGSEGKALQEIARVLTKKGELVLTTPNDYWFHTLTDPAYLLSGHRHYKKEKIIKILQDNRFTVQKCFIRGGFWCFVFMTWYYLLTYTVGIQIPKCIMIKEKDDYSVTNEKGVTIFLVGEKT